MTHSFIIRASLGLLAIAACATAAVGDVVTSKDYVTNLPSHPRLLLTRQGIEQMKARVAKYDWARQQWSSIKSKADKDLTEPVVLPPRGGNWFHWYACPKHGCALNTGKKIGDWQWEHKCPVGGETILGDPGKASSDYDGCVLNGLHEKWANATIDLGLAYQVTGDQRYAQKAREILLAYSERYLTYPIHNNNGEPKLGSRVGSQQLDESGWLIHICQGADLIWDTLDKSDRDAITSKILIPAAKDVIMPRPQGVHNIQCWRNSAMGLVGLLIGDNDLVSYAIDNPDTGFHTQMQKGVTPDGQWKEGAWGYHFYTMSALWNLTEAARNCGVDLYCPQFKSMFDAPLAFAMPNLHLPAFNDSTEVNLSSGSAIYELAYARYHDPACLELLSRGSRNNSFALFFGEGDLPTPPKAHFRSANYPSSGYAVLASGTGDSAAWLCMKYGPHGGGHGHPDKLSFVLYSQGKTIGYDPGTTRYGNPLHQGWCKATIAHNTLTVDESSQKQAKGECIAFGSTDGVDYAVCDAGPVYDGVRYTRTAAMLTDKLVVFIDQITSDQEHVYDIAYHQIGVWKDLPRGLGWTAPDKTGYKYLDGGTTRTTGSGISLTNDVGKNQSTVITLAGGEPTEVITATGVGSNIEDKVPVVIFRGKGRSYTAAWLVSLDGKPATIDRLKVSDTSAAAVSVTDSAGKKWTLLANPGKRRAQVSLQDGSEWTANTAFAVK